MTNQPKARIHQNVWGNWNAYLGTKKVREFGTDGREAAEWLKNPEVWEKENVATTGVLKMRKLDFSDGS